MADMQGKLIQDIIHTSSGSLLAQSIALGVVIWNWAFAVKVSAQLDSSWVEPRMLGALGGSCPSFLRPCPGSRNHLAG